MNLYLVLVQVKALVEFVQIFDQNGSFFVRNQAKVLFQFVEIEKVDLVVLRFHPGKTT